MMILALTGVRKFWTRSATIVSLIIAVVLVAIEFVAVGAAYSSVTSGSGTSKSLYTWLLTFPGAYDAIISLVFEFVGIVGLIYVATAAGSEWSWGTLKVAVTRGESRWKYTLATFASLSVILVIGLVITFFVGIVAALIGASLAGLPAGNPADPSLVGQTLVKLVRCAVALLALTSLGYAVAMIAKSQMAGIGTIIGYFVISFIGPALLPGFIKQIFDYLPFSVSANAIGLQGPPDAASSGGALDPNVALLITVAWLVGLLGIAALSVERTEIAG
jgi:ABC-2 type transport system permease protein